MKKNTCLLLLLSVFILNAQNEYTFSVSNGAYQDLTNPVSLNNGAVWDDPAYTIPIGFSFQIDGNSYNTLYLVDWGVGGMLSFSQNFQSISSIIAPVVQDIEDQGFSGTSQSPISYKLTGQPGNRVLKIEWKNVGFWDDATDNDFMNFQVWFYESSNILEYHYGPNSVVNPASFEGENGLITAFYPLVDLINEQMLMDGYYLSGDPSNPTVIIVNNSNSNGPPPPSLTGAPSNGTIYTFTPNNLSINENPLDQITIYPNPVSDYLHVDLPAAATFNKLTIFDSKGKMVKTFSQLNNNRLNLTYLSSGFYIVKFETATYTSIQKFIKQ